MAKLKHLLVASLASLAGALESLGSSAMVDPAAISGAESSAAKAEALTAGLTEAEIAASLDKHPASVARPLPRESTDERRLWSLCSDDSYFYVQM